MNKKVLVTGGAGYLGSVLTNKLLEKGCFVTVLDAAMFGAESLLPYLGNKNFVFIKGDIRDNKLLQSLFKEKFDCVFHLAALVGEPACDGNPKLAEDINCKATIGLAKLAKENGADRFIFTSSSSNYGVSRANELADENSPLNPLTFYSKTKVEAEKLLFPLNDSEFTLTIVRLSMLFGLSPKMRFNILINEFVRDAYFGKEVVIYKENSWRPYTHTQDAADAFITISETEKDLISGEVFNVGTENYRKKDLIELIERQIKKVNFVRKGGEVNNRDYKVSFKKIERILNFKPKKSVADGIKELIWAMRNNIFSNPYDEKYSAWINKAIFNKNMKNGLRELIGK
jgi:nucleoside-diphosphate-sugar epimerase